MRPYEKCAPGIATACQFDLTTFFNDFNLKSGDKIEAQVTATNNHGASEPSEINEPVVLPYADEIFIVAIEQEKDGSVVIAFQPFGKVSDNVIDVYQLFGEGKELVQRIQAGSFAGRRLAETESNLVFVTIGDLQQAAQYEFVLENMGVKSEPVQGSTRIPGAPDAPIDVHAISGSNEINVFWLKSSTVTEQYIYVQKFVSDFKAVAVQGFPKRLQGDLIGYTIKNLDSDATYTIQIQEANNNGKGPKSATLLVNTKAADPNGYTPIDLYEEVSEEAASVDMNYNGLVIGVSFFLAGILTCGVISFFVIRHFQKKTLKVEK